MVHSISIKVEVFGLVKHTKSVKNNVFLVQNDIVRF